jgi:hypothetical protein
MLLVLTGTFWISRPLGLSNALNVDICMKPGWSFEPTFFLASKLVFPFGCRGLCMGEAGMSLPRRYMEPFDAGLDDIVSPSVNVYFCAPVVEMLFSEDRCHERVLAEG